VCEFIDQGFVSQNNTICSRKKLLFGLVKTCGIVILMVGDGSLKVSPAQHIILNIVTSCFTLKSEKKRYMCARVAFHQV
jgi:hypothetical protein